METKSLGQLELEVLRFVWDRQSATVPEAAEALRAKGYARTTILTVMGRLHKKGFLKRVKEDGKFRYYPTQKKGTVLGHLARQFVENIFEGSPVSLVQHLAGERMRPEELERIRRIIDEALDKEGDQS